MPGAPNPASPPANPGHLSALQVAQLALKAGFSLDQIPTVVQLAFAESSFTPGAINHNTNGSTDYGLLQVNSVHGFDSQRLLQDPLYNLEAAKQVFDQQGWHAWTTYGSQRFNSAFTLGQTARNTAAGQSTTGRIQEIGAILAPFIGVAAASTEATAGAGASSGVVSSVAGGVAKGVATTATSGLARDIGIATVLAWLTTAKNWLRVLEFVGGAIAVYMALKSLTGADVPSAGEAARRVAML